MSHFTFRAILAAPLLCFALNSGAQWAEWTNVGVANSGNLVEMSGTFFISNDLYGIKKSTTDGSSWQTLSGWTGTVETLFGNNGYLFAATTNGVYRSSDLGSTWQLMNGSMPYSDSRYVHRFKVFGGVLFAMFTGNGGGFYRTADNGTTWTMMNVSSYMLDDMAKIGTRLFAIAGIKVYKSDDNGATWIVVNGEQGGVSLGVIGTRLVLSQFDFAPMLYSDDQGITWTSASGVSDNGWSSDEMVTYGGWLYAGVTGSIFRSNDGMSWVNYEGGTNNEYIRRLSLSGSGLYAVGDDNVFHLDGVIGVEEVDASTPSLYFDASTSTLRMTGANAYGPVDISILDGAGRMVFHRGNARLTAGLPVDLRPGIYCATLRASDMQKVLRFIVE